MIRVRDCNWIGSGTRNLIAVMTLAAAANAFGQSNPVEVFEERWLAETATDLNRSLPKQVDAETRLEGVTAGPGRRLNYQYTLISRTASSMDIESFNANMQPLLRTSICGKGGMQALIKNGVTLSYNYRGRDGKFVSMIEILPQHCG
ncbi:MAG: hypothetical protein ACKVQU_38390 [Burkholderiales bacterium]